MRLSPIVLGAIPAGLAVGFLAWFAAGGASADVAKLDALQTRLSALRPPRTAVAAGEGSGVAELASVPLFVMTTGPGAIPEPVVRLDGLVRSKARTAALLAVNERPAEWLAVGDVRDGVTLQQVLPSKVVVDTVFGPREVNLGERLAGAAAPASVGPAPTGPVGQTVVDQVPPGLRGPPPPASAPRAP